MKNQVWLTIFAFVILVNVISGSIIVVGCGLAVNIALGTGNTVTFELIELEQPLISVTL